MVVVTSYCSYYLLTDIHDSCRCSVVDVWQGDSCILNLNHSGKVGVCKICHFTGGLHTQKESPVILTRFRL